MTASFQHPSYFGRLSQAQAGDASAAPPTEPAARYRCERRYAERACCCTAQPAVIAVLPASNGGSAATDLLLCGHHYRQSRLALIARGATFLDLDGCPLTAVSWPRQAEPSSCWPTASGSA